MNARSSRYFLAIALLFGMVGSAHAGFLTLQVEGLPKDGAAYAEPIIGSDGNALITVTSPRDVGNYTVTGTVNSDPILYVDQFITNNTTDIWNGYTITVTPQSGWVLNQLTPLTPAFLPDLLPLSSVNVTPTQGQVYFYGGLVLPTQTVETRFSFDVTATSGAFGYCIINLPTMIPEPASLALVGLGAALLLRRRR